MSLQALTWAFEQAIPPSDKLTLIGLANFANEDLVCYPSRKRLAVITGLSDATVLRCLKTLEERKLIRREAQQDAMTGSGPNRYQLLIPGQKVNTAPQKPATVPRVTPPPSKAVAVPQLAKPTPPPKPVEEPYLDEEGEPFVFPIMDREKEWTLPKAKVEEWTKTYRTVDVPAQLVIARQWCRDNPGNRKTFEGMTRFLSSWMNRQMERIATAPVGTVPGAQIDYTRAIREACPARDPTPEDLALFAEEPANTNP